MLSWLILCFFGIASAAMVVIPTEKKIDLSGPSLRFKLLEAQGSAVYEYAESPALASLQESDGITVLSGCQPLSVASMVIERAEGGSIVNLFTNEDDKEPAVSVSTSMAVYEPAQVSDLLKSGTHGAVQVLAFKASAPLTVKKITLTRSQLPYIIL